jgi:hypothetical protein
MRTITKAEFDAINSVEATGEPVDWFSEKVVYDGNVWEITIAVDGNGSVVGGWITLVK